MVETDIEPQTVMAPWAGRRHLTTGARTTATWRVLPEPGEPVRPAPAAPEPEPAPAPKAQLLFDEADLARACAAVAATVRDAEAAAARASAEARIADSLERMAHALDTVDATVATQRRQFREAAAVLAAAATEALANGPGGKVAARLADALAADCLARFDPALALTVEVAPDIADALAARLAGSPVVQARPGRVAVEAVAGLAPGEARLVWTDGTADWSAGRLHGEAAALIRRLTEPATVTNSNLPLSTGSKASPSTANQESEPA